MVAILLQVSAVCLKKGAGTTAPAEKGF